MDKKQLAPIEVIKGRTFDLLLDATLNSLKRENTYGFNNEVSHLLSKSELVALVKSYEPEDSIELLLILQLLIGYMWSTESLSRGHSFESFTNLSLRAGDILIRYKSIKLKKTAKNVIPHEQIDIVE